MVLRAPRYLIALSHLHDGMQFEVEERRKIGWAGLLLRPNRGPEQEPGTPARAQPIGWGTTAETHPQLSRYSPLQPADDATTSVHCVCSIVSADSG
jgi:hypothetical protein